MAEIELHRGTRAASTRYVAAEVSYLQDLIVNVCFVGEPGARDREWTLVDAGLPGSADKIKRAAAELYGEESRPNAIVLTHGHFDHIGAIHTLAREWDVPVFAHELEMPYLTGRSAYPPPDPLVGGGMNSLLSILFPRGPIDLGPRAHVLPADGTVLLLSLSYAERPCRPDKVRELSRSARSEVGGPSWPEPAASANRTLHGVCDEPRRSRVD